MATTIVTLAMDAESQARFDGLRKAHYPAHLNRISAHLTMFHALPDTDEVRGALVNAVACTAAFTMRVSGVMSLGRGTAYGFESAELLRLHAELSRTFAADLIPQDRQRFRPHVVVQNKVSGDEARELQARLGAEFRDSRVQAVGIDWWDYLGGPWKLRERFSFGIDRSFSL